MESKDNMWKIKGRINICIYFHGKRESRQNIKIRGLTE